MTVREDREVAAPPAMTLAALATAGENLGFRVRDIRARPGVVVMSTGLSLRGLSLGHIITARVRRFNRGTRLSLDATPVLGSWARASADEALDDLVREFQLVLAAPHARIRRPERARAGSLPFGYTPHVLGGLWTLFSLLVFGWALSGLWWIPAGLGALGGLLVLAPRADAWWTRLVLTLALASLPVGLLGLVARRLARTNQLWQETVDAFQGNGHHVTASPSGRS